MSNPFLIEGPALISFSGGRTSGMMLYKIIEAYDGRLPRGVIPVFMNTGKEHTATLDFVDACARCWGTPVAWLEWCDAELAPNRWKLTSYYNASRNGEPFEAMMIQEKRLPNSARRICTKNLKVQTARQYAKSLGWKSWANPLGLRADEPRRIASARARNDGGEDEWEILLPMADAGIDREDVMEFWANSPFDLDLPRSGTTAGNCDLCYLKGQDKLLSLIREEPWRADWWIAQETRSGNLFRSDRPNYAALKYMATQPQLPGMESEDSLPCECHD